jgi:single-strand DNA-binding protein
MVVNLLNLNQMKSLRNSVRLMGNLGMNPEIRTTANNKKVASFSVATNESWRDHDGNQVKETQWHRVVAWGKLADLAEKILNKGTPVVLEGSINNRQYQDAKGEKRNVTEIVASDFLMVGTKKE